MEHKLHKREMMRLHWFLHCIAYSLVRKPIWCERQTDAQTDVRKSNNNINTQHQIERQIAPEESWIAEVIAGYWTSYLVSNNVVIPYIYNKVYRINSITIDNNNDSRL